MRILSCYEKAVERAKETVAPYRQMTKEIIDKLLCPEAARDSVQQATMARWDDLEQAMAAALAACAREEAKWWHTRVAMAALCDDQEVRGECRERMNALERAVGEKGKA